MALVRSIMLLPLVRYQELHVTAAATETASEPDRSVEIDGGLVRASHQQGYAADAPGTEFRKHPFQERRSQPSPPESGGYHQACKHRGVVRHTPKMGLYVTDRKAVCVGQREAPNSAGTGRERRVTPCIRGVEPLPKVRPRPLAPRDRVLIEPAQHGCEIYLTRVSQPEHFVWDGGIHDGADDGCDGTALLWWRKGRIGWRAQWTGSHFRLDYHTFASAGEG